MSKKKINNVNTEDKEKSTNTPNVTKIGYVGKVNLKFKIGNKVFNYSGHNNGTYTLKSLLCKFLCGNLSDAKSVIPTHLDIRYTGDEASWTSCLNSEIVLTGSKGVYSEDAETGSPKATFNAVIKKTNLNTDIEEDEARKFRLYLMCEENSNVSDRSLAYIEVEAKQLAKIVPGTDGIVEWAMEVINLDEAKELLEEE